MGKKKAFVEKKASKRFRLIPSSENEETTENGERFIPTQKHLEEQHKYGVFFDDDYDYMQHLRDVKEGFTLRSLDEEDEEVERVVIKAPAKASNPLALLAERPLHSTQKDVYDPDVDRILEGDFEAADGELADNFFELAGGLAAAPPPLLAYRRGNMSSDDDDEDYDSDEGFPDYEEENYGEGDEDRFETHRDGPQRDIDDAFDKLLEADYNEDQLGELDGDDERVGGLIEPDDGRLQKLAKEKRSCPEYDEELAKEYVKKRMALIEAGVIKDDDTELVEVDESASKRMKWDCESFASQYTNIYNHPTLIKDPNQCLSRRALKKLDRMNAKKEVIEEEMDCDDDDDLSQCTSVSTIRPKGETPEERRLRKQAVKAARRARIVERKQNQKAFADAHRKLAQSRLGQIKAKPIA